MIVCTKTKVNPVMRESLQAHAIKRVEVTRRTVCTCTPGPTRVNCFTPKQTNRLEGQGSNACT
eukprot:5116895-Pyramimonas_sp.AAC.2